MGFIHSLYRWKISLSLHLLKTNSPTARVTSDTTEAYSSKFQVIIGHTEYTGGTARSSNIVG